MTPEEEEWEAVWHSDDEWRPEKGGYMAWLVVALVAVAFFVALFGLAFAQDGLRDPRPQGYFGQGHEQYHQFYDGLRNSAGGSCCSGTDGRPTQARWNDVTGTWDVMIDGQWRTLQPNESFKVLTDAVLQKQGRSRWDSQAHIFTSPNGQTIYCFVPPASGG